MKYNKYIHPLYKSIGEKIEDWIVNNIEANEQECLRFLKENSEKYITVENVTELQSEPLGFIFEVYEYLFNSYEKEYIKYNENLRFDLGVRRNKEE